MCIYSCKIGRSTVSFITTRRSSESGTDIRSPGRPFSSSSGTHTWEQTIPRQKQEDTTPIDIPSQRFLICVTVPLGFRANRHSPSFGVIETLQLRLLHCALASKANLADSSTDGRVVFRAYRPFVGVVHDGNKAAPECPNSCLRDVRSWRSVVFFVKVTSGCIIYIVATNVNDILMSTIAGAENDRSIAKSHGPPEDKFPWDEFYILYTERKKTRYA